MWACIVAVFVVAACGGGYSGGDDIGMPDDAVAMATPAPGETYTVSRLPLQSLQLTGAASSLEDLLRTVERALVEHDTTRLFDLMASEREYRDILFPAFPAAHPPINADFASIWVSHFTDSYRGLMHLLRRYGGKDVEIQVIRFEKPNQDFTNFVLHETSRVDIETGGAREDNLRLFGSVFRVGDQWKVLSYPDESD